MSGAISIDSPTPTSTPNLKKTPFTWNVGINQNWKIYLNSQKIKQFKNLTNNNIARKQEEQEKLKLSERISFSCFRKAHIERKYFHYFSNLWQIHVF
jgi:hypothetical protein